MKALNFTLLIKRLRLPVLRIFYAVVVSGGSFLVPEKAAAQCSPSYNQATLNWDCLDYFTYSGYYTSADGYLPDDTWAYTQYFAFGAANRLTIEVDNSITLGGEVSDHTGDAGSYGTGDDVLFQPTGTTNSTITLTFEQEVENVQFSLYDLDVGHRVRVGARNASNNPQTVSMSLAIAGAPITFSGNPGNNPQANASGAGFGNADEEGTVNIDIAGPVQTITITLSSATSVIYMSDITACTAGSFPLNYFNVSQPFNGQPGYVLHAFNKDVYALDPATGVTKYLFTDSEILGTPSGSNRCYINSMAYDPFNRILYYVFSLSTDPGANRKLKKYDFNTETISTVLNDVTTIGIPVVTQSTGVSAYGRGVESGAAAFFNGALYLGIETVNRNSSGSLASNSNRENVIYRIDFDAGNNPYRASQVFALPCDDGSGTLINDWADFTIRDGELINFDGAGVTSQSNVYHFDMMTGALTDFPLPSWTPGQPTVDWQGNLYQVHARGSSELPHVAPYNEDGTLGAATFLTSSPMFTPSSPSLGDAAEAFRPKSDFGDAPASFDPDPLAPATHEYDANIRLGATYDYEWNLTSSTGATADGADEDAIGAAPALNYEGVLTYTVNNISVFNNTGEDATLAGWLDYNFDGVFDAGESVSITVPSSASQQLVSLSWNSIPVWTTSELNTFLRLRLTKTSNGMTAADMNGWFADGEVEDFPVLIGISLPKDMQSFTVHKNNDVSVGVQWSIHVQQPVANFEVLRSTDNITWQKIGTVTAHGGTGLQDYSFKDNQPYTGGTSYYRLHINYAASLGNKFSNIRSVHIGNGITPADIRILPNPASNYAELQLTALTSGNAIVQLYDNTGRRVASLQKSVQPGINILRLDNLDNYAAGTYTVRLLVDGKTSNVQLIIGNH